MATYVFRDGAMILRELAPPLVVGKRSGLPMPMIIRDHLDDVVNPVDGRPYSSKRAYEKAVRAAGCEIAGNDPSIMRQKPTVEDSPLPDVEQAYRDVANGYRPDPVVREAIEEADSIWR